MSVGLERNVRYFDDQAKDGATPTYSWRKMKICSPFRSWGYMISNVYTDPITVAFGGTLYVGAILDGGNFHICSSYDMDLGEWPFDDSLDNSTETYYNDDKAPPSVKEFDGYIYLIGGSDYDGTLRAVNKYDIAQDCWVDCCDLKAAVAECNLAIMDKKVLILDTKCYGEGEEPSAIIQMYDPAKNESFIVLDAAGLEKDGLKNEDLQLAVQNGLCYVICDPKQECTVSDPDDSDDESSSPKENDDGAIQVDQNTQVFEQNPQVFKLVCNLDSDSPSVALGEEIPQNHPHRHNYIRAFCIDDKTFVNIHGCVHKIKDGIANEEDLKKWRNITKTSQRPVYFTYDRRELGGTKDDEDENSECE